MKRIAKLRWMALASVVLLGGWGSSPARAQADPDDVKRGVARISLMDGDISVKRGDSGDWVAGVLNAPLMAGDSIATSPGARGEVEFDASSVLRIGSDSNVRIADLEVGRYQIELDHGTVTYRVLRESEADIELDTPNVAIRPSRGGAYRITVTEDGETVVTARSGAVEVTTPSGSQWVNAGQTMEARGTATSPEFRFVAALARDSWDSWNDGRDATELNSTSAGYVPAGVYGTEDLDRYGNWSYVPDYGYCWTPAVALGWSPYSLGRWAWMDWYGWSWVSYDPWGWAPYHYGRWFHRNSMWYWYPGSLYSRQYWSPALVGFFGWGGVGMGFGNIGWVPLAPFEAFHPWWGRANYGHYDVMIRNMRINTVSVSTAYINSRVPGGITAMRRLDFEGGRFHNLTHYSGEQIGRASVVQGGLPIAPSASNLRYSDRQVAGTPRTTRTTGFAARQPAPAVQRIPFAEQQRSFQQATVASRTAGAVRPGGESTAPGSTRPSGAAASSAVGAGRAVTQSGQTGEPGGWRRVGEPGGPSSGAGTATQSGVAPRQTPSQATGAAEPGSQQNRSGWQRFGSPGTTTPSGQTPSQASPQVDRSGWDRFGNPNTNRPQTMVPSYPNRNAAPQYNAPAVRPPSGPAYSAPQAPRQAAPAYSAPPAARPSAPSAPAPARSAPAPSGGGGASHGGGGGGRR